MIWHWWKHFRLEIESNLTRNWTWAIPGSFFSLKSSEHLGNNDSSVKYFENECQMNAFNLYCLLTLFLELRCKSKHSKLLNLWRHRTDQNKGNHKLLFHNVYYYCCQLRHSTYIKFLLWYRRARFCTMGSYFFECAIE